MLLRFIMPLLQNPRPYIPNEPDMSDYGLACLTLIVLFLICYEAAK